MNFIFSIEQNMLFTVSLRKVSEVPDFLDLTSDKLKILNRLPAD